MNTTYFMYKTFKCFKCRFSRILKWKLFGTLVIFYLTGGMVAGSSGQAVRMVPDQVTYYFQQQQQQQQQQHQQPTAAALQPQIIQLQVHFVQYFF